MRYSRKDPEHSEEEEEERDGVAAVLGKAKRGAAGRGGPAAAGSNQGKVARTTPRRAEGRVGSAESWGRKDDSGRIPLPDPGTSAAAGAPRTHAPAGILRRRPRRGQRRGDPAAPGSSREAEPAARALDRLAILLAAAREEEPRPAGWALGGGLRVVR